jgi:hypothetical protein
MNGRPADVVLSDLAKTEVFPARASSSDRRGRHLDCHTTAYFIPADFEVQKHDYVSTQPQYRLVEFAKSARFES